MRTAVRIIICAFMVAVAVTMATFTLAGFTGSAVRTPPSARDSLYVLGESDGNVAVYGRDDLKTPLTVTGIELAGLRERDRALIAEGLPVGSQEELARLLEDLGS